MVSYFIVQNAVRTASSNEDSTPTCVYHAIIRGLERLVVSFALSSAESDSLVKLSVDRWVGWGGRTKHEMVGRERQSN